ncbi:MAG: hypothetical protein QM579_05025 [Desulfovibrio sp.]
MLIGRLPEIAKDLGGIKAFIRLLVASYAWAVALLFLSALMAVTSLNNLANDVTPPPPIIL